MKEFILFTCLLLPFLGFSQEWENGRALREIKKFEREWPTSNPPVEREHSPWLSGDGLRLYYITGIPYGHIQFTFRPHPDSLFNSTPTVLSLAGTNEDVYHVWLSNDELSLYYSLRDGKSYHVRRSSINGSFSEPLMLTFTGAQQNPSIFSLNATQERLFCNSATKLYEYIRTSISSFALKDSTTLPIPSYIRWHIGGGQLSKDGLSYFISSNYTNPFSMSFYKIFQLTRANQEDQFSLDTLYDVGVSGYGASFSNNLDYVVFERLDPHNDDTTDLGAATKRSIVTSTLEPSDFITQFKLYPNSTLGKFSILTQTTDNHLNVEVYNSLGKKVYQNKSFNPAQSKEIDLTGEASGVYFVTLSDGENRVGMEKLVIE
ncbi:MAG TPA: T9SS type A sorting domain-containing protein [Cytophagaceae bacterium]|jgi:hypothetical protein